MGVWEVGWADWVLMAVIGIDILRAGDQHVSDGTAPPPAHLIEKIWNLLWW